MPDDRDLAVEALRAAPVPASDPTFNALLPAGLRWLGPLLEPLYGAGVRVHRSLAKPRLAPLPVICVGNLTVGGTGKTPMVQYLARGLAARGRKPAVLMRGYKAQGVDEAAETSKALADLRIPVLVGADRWASACQAKAQGCDVALLDDGFQHWRLARDLDIVLIDATNPFGGGHLIPRGRLRERPVGLARAGVVVLTRSNAVAPEALAQIEQSVRDCAPGAACARAEHAPVALQECTHPGNALPVSRLNGAKVYAVCAIGNPYGFSSTLLKLGAKVLHVKALPDHYRYDAWDVDFSLIDAAKAAGAEAIVVTEKDAVKLEPLLHGVSFPIWSLAVELKITAGEQELWQRVEKALESAAKRLQKA